MSSSSWPFFSMKAGTAQLKAITSPSTVRRIGTPTVNIQCDFAKPLQIGDTLHWELRVLKAGRASVQLEYRGQKDGADHLKIVQTIVFMDLDRQVAVPIPEDLRSRIEEFLVPAT